MIIYLALLSRKQAIYFLKYLLSGLWGTKKTKGREFEVLKTGVWLQRYWQSEKIPRQRLGDLKKLNSLKDTGGSPDKCVTVT